MVKKKERRVRRKNISPFLQSSLLMVIYKLFAVESYKNGDIEGWRVSVSGHFLVIFYPQGF